MANIVGFLLLAWIALTSFITLGYWFTPDLTPAKFEEAVALCGDRKLKHIDLGLKSHIVVCEDDGEYSLPVLNI